jgi:hypothetical protein
MIRLPRAGKFLLAAMALSGSLATVQPASAQAWVGPHHRTVVRVVRGPRCFVQRTVVRGPYGGRHVAVRRICR